MTLRNPTYVSHVGGILSVEDFRLQTGALLMPVANFKSQSGIRPAASEGFLVTASGTADKFVHVATGQLFIQGARSTAGGVYVCTSDAALAIDMLTANPANATNPRNDLIIAYVTDEFYGDGTNVFAIAQVVGTPAASPSDPSITAFNDAIKLARVRVPANATTILTSNITDLRAGVYTVGLGGILPVPSQAARNTTTPYNGFAIARTDRKWVEVYDGTAYRVQGTGIVTSIADLAAITDPLTGQLASNTADGLIYRYTGSTWIGLPGGIMAAPTTTASDGTPTATTVETRDAVLGNYVFTAVAGRRYRVWLTGRAIQGSVANDRFAVRIRNGGASTPTASSTQIAETDVITYVTGGSGQASFITTGTFVPGAGAVTLGAFTLRAVGTGVGTPRTVGPLSEFYAEDIGGV